MGAWGRSPQRAEGELLPESVRWLYTRGRYDDIEIIFNKIAKINKTENSLQNVLTDLRTPKPIGTKDKNQVGMGEAQEPVKSLRLTAVFKCVRHD
ncbi:hypothetical protein J6590_070997 [Homalodisca vitripennis]|nr:hypothetical protein J6590_070997 [Homalodisca vitripennis]